MTITIDDVLGAVTDQVASFDIPLEDGGTEPIQVVKRKLPLKQQNIDPATQIIVCPSSRPGGERPFWFRRREYTYLVDVVLIAPNANNQLGNLPEHSLIIQTLLEHFSKPLTAPPPPGGDGWPLATRTITSIPVTLFDRKAIAELKLDVLAIQVTVTAVVRVMG